MFKYWSIRKYGTKLLPALEKRYGKSSTSTYTASQIRATVYQEDFNPKYLPLGYILFLNPHELNRTIKQEFSDFNIESFKQEIVVLLNENSFPGNLSILQRRVA